MDSIPDKGRPKYLTFNIHAMACTNRCLHCWTNGSGDHKTMNIQDVEYVLGQMKKMKSKDPSIFIMPLFFDEPSSHPEFPEIVRLVKEMGFINMSTFWPTNCSGLSALSDRQWKTLKDNGLNGLQLTFFGMEKTHDAFAGRKGAFADLVKTIEKAEEFGIEWYAGLTMHKKNVGQIKALMEYVRSLSPSGKAQVGWFIFSHQGRATSLKRPVTEDLKNNLIEYREDFWQEEKSIAREILDTPELRNRKYSNQMCYQSIFDIYPDFSVTGGGACDSGGIIGVAPWIGAELVAGNLKETDLACIIENYSSNQPAILRSIENVTWGELAEKYGDLNNDELFHKDDLVKSKWMGMYLEEFFKARLSAKRSV